MSRSSSDTRQRHSKRYRAVTLDLLSYKIGKQLAALEMRTERHRAESCHFRAKGDLDGRGEARQIHR